MVVMWYSFRETIIADSGIRYSGFGNSGFGGGTGWMTADDGQTIGSLRLLLHCVLDMPRDGYWAAAVAGDGKVHGGSFFCEEGDAPTIYYSTKVRFCDKVAENLILVCRDLGAGRRDFGG